MIDAVKEWMDEWENELLEEENQAKEQAALLAEKLKSLSMEEVYITILWAPYRELFIPDLTRAHIDERPAYRLCTTDISEDKREEAKKLIERDFDVSDAESFESEFFHIQTSIRSLLLSKNEDAMSLLSNDNFSFSPEEARILEKLVLDNLSESKTNLWLLSMRLSRLSYMTSTSVWLWYVSLSDVQNELITTIKIVYPLIKDWNEYGQSIIVWEKEDGTNNIVGRKLIANEVKNLLQDKNSPWLLYPRENITKLRQ